MKIVNEPEGNEGTRKEARSEEMEAPGILPVEEEKARGSQEFNERIMKGNRGTAGPAFASKEDVGEDRDVIVEFNSALAAWTGGRRTNQAQVVGKAIDDHVEEAAPSEAEEEENYLFHHIFGGLISPLSGL